MTDGTATQLARHEDRLDRCDARIKDLELGAKAVNDLKIEMARLNVKVTLIGGLIVALVIKAVVSMIPGGLQ